MLGRSLNSPGLNCRSPFTRATTACFQLSLHCLLLITLDQVCSEWCLSGGFGGGGRGWRASDMPKPPSAFEKLLATLECPPTRAFPHIFLSLAQTVCNPNDTWSISKILLFFSIILFKNFNYRNSEKSEKIKIKG